MNAVVATPLEERKVECKSTRQHPRVLVVSRMRNYVHVTVMTPATRKRMHELLAVADSDPKDAAVRINGPKSWLEVGRSSFPVSQADAERLRDELQIPARSST